MKNLKLKNHERIGKNKIKKEFKVGYNTKFQIKRKRYEDEILKGKHSR